MKLSLLPLLRLGLPVFLFSAASQAQAATVSPVTTTIVTTLNDEDDGTESLDDLADISLREAINHSPADSLIIFDPALNGGTITLAHDDDDADNDANQLLIGKSLSIDASALLNGITIDADASMSDRRRAFEIVADVTVAMNNLTVTGGWTADGEDAEGVSPSGGDGGGILSNGSLILTGCTVSGNRTGNGIARDIVGGAGGAGGGIFANGSLAMTGCIVSDNLAGNGGVGASQPGFGGDGGGIRSEGDLLTLTSCTVSGNRAGTGAANAQFTVGGSGGGISMTGNSLVMTACTVNDNRGGDAGGGASFEGFFAFGGGGGGISMTGKTLLMTTCTVSGNLTGKAFGPGRNSSGGGISFGVTEQFVLNGCTVSSNVVDIDVVGLLATSAVGGGISVNPSHGDGIIDIRNSIIALNTSNGANVVIDTDLNEDGADDFEFDPSNFIDDLRILEGGELVAADGDPELSPLGDNGGSTQTMAPLPDSPVINSEKATYTHMFDQRGFVIADELPDIGAVEIFADGEGSTDLTPLWDIDLDCDGHTFGVEFALGTDPLVSDPGNPANPQFSFNDSGAVVIDFGVNAQALGHAVWILQRSSDLKTWTEVCRSDALAFPTTFIETDLLDGSDAFYYRFKAEQK